MAVGASARERAAARPRPRRLDRKIPLHDGAVALSFLFPGASRRAVETIAAERADERAGDHADAAMPKTVQVIHRFVGGFRVVDVHARNTERGAELAAVHDRRAPRLHHANHRRGFARKPMAEKNQPVSLFAPQHHRVALFAFLIVLRVADEHRVAFALGDGFDALEDQREERIGNIGDRHDQLPRPQGAKIFVPWNSARIRDSRRLAERGVAWPR